MKKTQDSTAKAERGQRKQQVLLDLVDVSYRFPLDGGSHIYSRLLCLCVSYAESDSLFLIMLELISCLPFSPGATTQP